MKVDGVLDVVLTDFNYYLKLMGRDSKDSYQSKYRRVMNSFYNEELIELDNQINKELEKREKLNKSKISSTSEIEETEPECSQLENENSELEDNILDSLLDDLLNDINHTESPNIEENIKSNSFLDLIQESSDDVDNVNYVEHGIFIDEWVSTKSEETNECNDEIDSEGYETIEEESINFEDDGIEYVEEEETIENSFEEDFNENNKDIESELNEDDDLDLFLDELLNDSRESDSFVEDTKEENSKNEENITIEVKEPEVIDKKDSDIHIEKITDIKESSEVVVVPTNIRDFIKEHQGSDISYVTKYYSKKDVEKAIGLGRIYKKNGKLYT